ncbi:MAG: BsuPI-related putative proteinase inhibitor [Bacteroidota bacterium]|nr:BsuPI-related putative proteinase inhibitor [Bacteroidota bacterium]
MKKLLIYSFCLFAIFLTSCKKTDSVVSPLSENPEISVIIDASQNAYNPFKDEVVINPSGLAVLERHFGASPQSISRRLNSEEHRYILTLIEEFLSLDSAYVRQPPYERDIIFTITYRTASTTKVVKSDGIIHDDVTSYYRPHKILRNIRSGLTDVWESLITLNKYKNILQFNFTPSKLTFNLDEEINLKFEVTSLVNYDFNLNFSTSAQCGYKIYKAGKKVVDYPDGAWTVLTTWMIPAMQSDSQNFLWSQLLDDTSGQLGTKAKAGKYTIAQYLVDQNSTLYFSEITITEEGTALSSRLIRDYFSFPVTFTYDLNNRISKPSLFNFSSDKKVGFVVKKVDGTIVFADSSLFGQPSQLQLKPFDDFRFNFKWNNTDNNGNQLPSSRYIIEMWLVEQIPDHRAKMDYYFIN